MTCKSMYSNKANIGSYLSGYWKSDILMYKSAYPLECKCDTKNFAWLPLKIYFTPPPHHQHVPIKSWSTNATGWHRCPQQKNKQTMYLLRGQYLGAAHAVVDVTHGHIFRILVFSGLHIKRIDRKQYTYDVY